ncbi:capsid staple protein [Solidesulfovibrio magneticus]|uniref:Uncharacterized protein n=1 Tax=Solidesulfovibrio magneticus (strain ATCC 700980 / DSM 13731 / RS-1) TaxID=573370 RepID=C4XTK2_SOLM1|nr:hypothetical protein [Solidesulfovibrio magneticus]BAH75999.1 hypothetical protein DMR_25080 [Solidesulfovibrio magneticus RS-1]
MSKLVSMARTAAERKTERKGQAVASRDGEKFPWGLGLSLDGGSLRKLGRSVGDFVVGETVELACRARVTRVNSTADQTGDESSVVLQIEALGVESPESKRAEAIRKVYGRSQ